MTQVSSHDSGEFTFTYTQFTLHPNRNYDHQETTSQVGRSVTGTQTIFVKVQ